MRSEVNDAQKLVRVELRDYIGRLAAEAGIVDPGVGRSSQADEERQEATGRNSAAARALAARKSSEQELKSFQDRCGVNEGFILLQTFGFVFFMRLL